MNLASRPSTLPNILPTLAPITVTSIHINIDTPVLRFEAELTNVSDTVPCVGHEHRVSTTRGFVRVTTACPFCHSFDCISAQTTEEPIFDQSFSTVRPSGEARPDILLEALFGKRTANGDPIGQRNPFDDMPAELIDFLSRSDVSGSMGGDSIGQRNPFEQPQFPGVNFLEAPMGDGAIFEELFGSGPIFTRSDTGERMTAADVDEILQSFPGTDGNPENIFVMTDDEEGVPSAADLEEILRSLEKNPGKSGGQRRPHFDLGQR